MVDPSEMSLLDALGVEDLGDDCFGARYPRWWEGERVFGGLVLGQAVAAASATVSDATPIHSLHGYFLRPASPGDESTIEVSRVRDGRSFTTRATTTRVRGRHTFEMLASFQVPEEGEEYQLAIAPVPGPDVAISTVDEPNEWDGPFEVIELGPSEQAPDGTYASTRRAWIRCSVPLPSDPWLHAAIGAYASDMTRAAFRPGSLGTWGEHVDASLDHSVWFHRPTRMDAWHLFDLHVVTTGAGRSVMRGTMHDAEGRLVLSMAQEILIRRLDGGVPVRFDDPDRPPETP